MHQYKFSLVVAATLAAFALAGCGSGSSAGSQAPKIQFTSQVTFGDSLSDVGSYEVGFIAAAYGGRFTVNTFLPSGAHAPTNYTELLAAQLGLPAPCAAQTGLQFSSSSPEYPLSVPVVQNAGCTGYAQGGSRVTGFPGIGNQYAEANGFALTLPVQQQIALHLQTHGGKFSGTEDVLVLAGANDIFFNFGLIAASAETPTQALTAVVQAATDLVGYVNNQIIANGANYVVVMNVPDISTTPFGFGAEAQAAGSQALLKGMVQAYNSTLQAGLTSSKVLYVDLFTVSDQQISNPSIFGLTNVSTPACNLNYPNNILATQGSADSGSSLVCNTSNLIPGDVSNYEFADTVHPTPYGNILLARYVATQMVTKGWL